MWAVAVVSLLAAIAIKETACSNLFSSEPLLEDHRPPDRLPGPEPVVPAEE